MTAGPLRILFVEDSATDAKLVLRALRGLGPLQVERVDTRDQMIDCLDQQPWDVVLSDWSIPDFGALPALRVLREKAPDIPFIIVSGTIGEETAVAAMRAGARDFVLKDKLGRLPMAIRRELQERAARREAEAGRARAERALRHSEEQLRQAQKMEAVGRLAGGVAHDFNNLLSVILTYVQMAVATMDEGNPVREDLVEVHTAAVKAAALTRQLLLFSRQEPAQTVVLDLHDALKGLHRMIRRIVGEDIELILVPPPAGGRVRADPSHIEQVIMNLVVNARDAMPRGGKLTIETSNVVVDPELGRLLSAPPGDYVMMSVSDTGVGIHPEVQARIFDPFFTTKEAGKGTGLGLSTVFGIVKQSAGTIWVESELAVGTTFKIYLPRVDDVADAPEAPAAPVELGGAETILVVEDDAQVRAVANDILTRFGYRVLSTAAAEQAIELCATHQGPIDLLVTDVVMPNMSGPELARRLAASRPQMKVICMSGYTDDSVVRHGMAEAGVGYLQKPITPLGLASKVRAVLDAVEPPS